MIYSSSSITDAFAVMLFYAEQYERCANIIILKVIYTYIYVCVCVGGCGCGCVCDRNDDFFSTLNQSVMQYAII